MSLQRVITEFGTGNDLHGGDYTKAAVRAVQDAIHHSSLTLIRSLGVNARTMQVEVTIGAQQPGRVDLAAVKAALPHGEVTCNCNLPLAPTLSPQAGRGSPEGAAATPSPRLRGEGRGEGLGPHHPRGPVGVGRLLGIGAAARDAPHHRLIGGPRHNELLHQLVRQLDPRLFDHRADLLGARLRQMAQIAALTVAHPR